MTSIVAGRRIGRGSPVVWVGAGIAVYGLSSFGFLAIAAHRIGNDPAYTALALLWTLLNAVGIGLYLPVEQETARAVAARRSQHEPTRPGVMRPVRYAVWSLAALAIACSLLDPVLRDLVFSGQPRMASAFALGLVGMAVAYLARGTLSGNDRFARYGTQLALDGALRVGGATVLAVAGVRDPLLYGAVLALAPVVATAGALLGARSILTAGGRDDAPPARMSLLVLASVTSQALANAGPVAAQLLATANDVGTVANLVNALTVARIPLFLFAAVQAVFLPRLAADVARGARDSFVLALRRAAVWTSAIGGLGVLATVLVGPFAVRVLFGSDFEIERGTIVLLALSAVLFMIAQLVVQALLARHRDLDATLSWLVGFGLLMAALLLSTSLATRVAVALLVGSGGAAVVASARLRRELSAWPTTSSEAS